MRRALLGFASGLLFGAGLLVSGMVDPRNVVGFLDFAGRWNPTLAGVMAGAIAVHAALLRARSGDRLALARSAPQRAVDGRLVGGAALFGVGWGLAGYCPGPAVVALGFGTGRAVSFVAAMVLGGLLAERLAAPRELAAAAAC